MLDLLIYSLRNEFDGIHFMRSVALGHLRNKAFCDEQSQVTTFGEEATCNIASTWPVQPRHPNPKLYPKAGSRMYY